MTNKEYEELVRMKTNMLREAVLAENNIQQDMFIDCPTCRGTGVQPNTYSEICMLCQGQRRIKMNTEQNKVRFEGDGPGCFVCGSSIQPNVLSSYVLYNGKNFLCKDCNSKRLSEERHNPNFTKNEQKEFDEKNAEVYSMSEANNQPNSYQVGGSHYSANGKELQHWDLVIHYKWDYFQGQIIKYIMRYRDKNGLEDLKKARHYLDKYIEAIEKETTNKVTTNHQ